MDGAADTLTQVAVEAEIKKEVANLSSSDESVQAQALAGLSILLTHSDEAPPAELLAAVPTVVRMLATETTDVGDAIKGNALVLLTTLLSCSEALWSAVMATGFVKAALGLMQAAPPDSSLAFNAAAGLVEAIRGGDEAAESLVAAGGVGSVIKLCDTTLPERVQEVAADLVCCIASTSGHRDLLVQQGAVERLGQLLATPNTEVRLRSLLGLGMLLPGQEASQLVLAQQPGAAANLMALIRQREDPDCHQIARDIFAGLAGNQACKPFVEAALRTAAAE